MGWKLKRRSKACFELKDRISGLPDEILCRILSFLATIEAVRTCVLSHRWNNVWASVPNIVLHDDDTDDAEGVLDLERFARLVYHVLFSRGSANIHRFELHTKMPDVSWADDWICTAIRLNVVELDVDLCGCFSALSEPVELPAEPYELPKSLYMCQTLEDLKLRLHTLITLTPHPTGCFPNLKFLHVDVKCPNADSMEKLFTCCPVLEDLFINLYPQDDAVSNVNICAPKLKRLRINLFLDGFGVVYDHKIFINANTPNLENFIYDGNILAVFSSKNAKSLKTAKINFMELHWGLDAPELLHKHFAGIGNVKDLQVSAPIFGNPHIVYRYHLPTLNNLKRLELVFHSCCSWQSLINFLNASPNMESLGFVKNARCFHTLHYKDELKHEWSPPVFVPVCISSRLKTVRMQGFRGRSDEMKVAEYFLKHGEVLDDMILCTRARHWKLWEEVQKFPRVSQTCQIVCTEN